MQQKLAVASVLVLALLAGASALMIETHALNQSRAPAPAQPGAQGAAQQGTNSTAPSQGGSLLISGHPSSSGYAGDDGNDTELEGASAVGYVSDP